MAVLAGVLGLGIYIVHRGNTDSWIETNCVVTGSRVIPEGIRGTKHAVVMYRGQYQLRYRTGGREYFIWADTEWSDEIKEFVQSKVDRLPERCDFRIRYNPLQPVQAIAITK